MFTFASVINKRPYKTWAKVALESLTMAQIKTERWWLNKIYVLVA